jgi:hypothetical protein
VLGAAVRQVVAVHARDHHVAQAELGHRLRHPPRLVRVKGAGMPVATLQKEQARVQVSPMIIMVAWRCDQHSPMFGQAASSHTVTRRLSRISARVSW